MRRSAPVGRNLNGTADVNVVSLQYVTATEAIVANGNPQPGDKTRHPGGVQQPQVYRLVAKHGGQEAQTGNHRRRIQRITRHATTRQFSENARRFTVTRRVYSIRVDAYIPELPADSTAVRITAFITAAAESRPACWNTRVNGLTLMSLTSLRSRLGWCTE